MRGAVSQAVESIATRSCVFKILWILSFFCFEEKLSSKASLLLVKDFFKVSALDPGSAEAVGGIFLRRSWRCCTSLSGSSWSAVIQKRCGSSSHLMTDILLCLTIHLQYIYSQDYVIEHELLSGIRSYTWSFLECCFNHLLKAPVERMIWLSG